MMGEDEVFPKGKGIPKGCGKPISKEEKDRFVALLRRIKEEEKKQGDES